MKTKKDKENYHTLTIDDAIFFPKDFEKFPEKCIICVDKGVILVPKKKRTPEDKKLEEKQKWHTHQKHQKK